MKLHGREERLTLYVAGGQGGTGKLLPQLHLAAAAVEEDNRVHIVEYGQICLRGADRLHASDVSLQAADLFRSH